MITNNSTLDNDFIGKVVMALNLGHLDIIISEEDDLVNLETLSQVFGQTQYEISMGYADVVLNKTMQLSTKEVTFIHELCHVADRDCETIIGSIKMNQALDDIYYIYHEKAIENYARAIYLLIRGEKYDGLQDFSQLPETE